MGRTYYHCGGHPLYSGDINAEIISLDDALHGRNGKKKISADEARREVMKLQNYWRGELADRGTPQPLL